MASSSSMRGFALLQQRGRQAWNSFTDLLFPPQCGGCQTMGSLWCEACRAAVKLIGPPWCEKCGEPFGELLAAYWHGERLTADWLIPVPLHPSRERDRGYNQSELLARSLARRVNVPVNGKGLRRTRVTAVQMTLNAAQRRENVAGAFDCVEGHVRGARVIIIDDVGTTGATLDACAQAVLKAGAASVMGLTLARTP